MLAALITRRPVFFFCKRFLVKFHVEEKSQIVDHFKFKRRPIILTMCAASRFVRRLRTKTKQSRPLAGDNFPSNY